MKRKRLLFVKWGAPVLVVVSIAFAALYGCAPQAGSESSGSSSSTTADSSVLADWSYGIDCGQCHSNAAGSFANQKCLASKHASLEKSCNSCHTDESALVTVHTNAKSDKAPAKKLKKTEVTSDACLSCHKKENLIQAGSTSTMLTDEKGNVVNPHSLPTVDEHADITCTSCHDVHDESSIAETAPATCRTCHHADVYECGTCHPKK